MTNVQKLVFQLGLTNRITDLTEEIILKYDIIAYLLLKIELDLVHSCLNKIFNDIALDKPEYIFVTKTMHKYAQVKPGLKEQIEKAIEEL